MAAVLGLGRRARAAAAAVLLFGAPAFATTDELAAGRAALERGRFATAAGHLERAGASFADAGEPRLQMQALQALAEARQALGHHDLALTALASAAALAEAQADAGALALLQAQLGGAHLLNGRDDLARPRLLAALDRARRDGHEALTAAVLNDLGTLYRSAGDAQAAGEAYDQAHRLATRLDDPALALRTLINAASLAIARQQPARARALALSAENNARRLHTQPWLQAQGLLRAGLLLAQAARTDEAARAQAWRSLDQARGLATDLGQAPLVSAANGVLAMLYHQAARHAEASGLVERAIFDAQRAGDAELLFRWHWLAARIHRARGERERAIGAYRLAHAAYEEGALAPAAQSLPWDEPGHTAYLELADLLLLRSATQAQHDSQRDLTEARDAVEKLKAGELRDYFRDACVTEARAHARGLVQSLEPGTAVLYPIVLPERIELLLNLGAQIRRYTVVVSEATVLETGRRFRAAVQRQRTRAYLAPAQTLYGWLIAPLAADLEQAGVKTLVTVPDHALRALPLAALHDGEAFVLERFAVAMAPGLELIDPRPLPPGPAHALIAGLSEPVQGYPALPYVDIELANVGRHLAGRTLRNEAFVRGELEQVLTGERVSIAHIASHGEFSGDVRASFVLTHDGKVDMDELARYIGFNRFRDDPLDLLTLSACQTAAGDERAALGLAGITVKAGARSALASLWPIHDEATALLMSEFYTQVFTPGVSKARALQQAQRKLGALTRYRHPGYWAGFVLIGSWR